MVGKDYKTRGGWKARIVWIQTKKHPEWKAMYVVHKPETDAESMVVKHRYSNGTHKPTVTIGCVDYGKHLGDLVSPWEDAWDNEGGPGEVK